MSGENQEPPASEARPGRRQRRPATIDLTATEMPGEASERPVAEAEQAEAPDSQSSQQSGESGAAAGDGSASGSATAHAGANGGRRRGLSPWIAGGAAGAGIALAIVGAFWALGLATQSEREGLGARLTALEQRVRQLAHAPADPRLDEFATGLATIEQNARGLKEMQARLAQIEAAPPRSGGDEALSQRLAAIEGVMQKFNEDLSGLRRRVEEAAASIREARAASEAARAAARDAPKEAAKEIAQELEQSPGASATQEALQVLQGRIGALEERLTSVQAELGAAKARPESDQAARRALLARALLAAAESGQPFAAELAGLKALGAEGRDVAALEPHAAGGLATAAEVRRDFAAIERALLAAAERRSPEAGLIARLQASAERLVRVRPATEGPGRDIPSTIARIEAQLGRGDVAAAVAEFDALPPSLRALGVEWLQRTQARVRALEAARRLADDAVRGLGRAAS